MRKALAKKLGVHGDQLIFGNGSDELIVLAVRAFAGKGDEVVTNGGIVGKVVSVKDDNLTIKSGDSTLVVQRGRVAGKVGDTAKSA